METAADVWHVYEFSCMYIGDLWKDYEVWLKRCNLKSKNRVISKMDMTTVTVLTVGDATASLLEIMNCNSLSSDRRFSIDSGFEIAKIDVPVVLIANEKDEYLIPQLLSRTLRNIRRPIVIIVLENKNSELRTNKPILRGSETTRTSFVQTNELIDCINNLLERSAFDVVYNLVNTLQNIRRKIEVLSTLSEEEETLIYQRLEDYLNFLEKCGYEITTKGSLL